MMPINESAVVPAALSKDRLHQWTALPAAQNPQWRNHPAYAASMDALTAAPGLVRPDDLVRLRGALAQVALGHPL